MKLDWFCIVRLRAALLLAIGWSALGCGRTLVEPSPGEGGVRVTPLFVAVGAKGTIVTSFDGIAWTVRASGVGVHISSVAAGPSGFVAVGAGGVILRSPDGLAWVPAESPTQLQLRDVIYAEDQFVAVGEDWTAGAVAVTSADGVVWTALEAPADHMFHGVAHGAGTVIAAAYFRSDLQTPTQFHRMPGGAWIQREGPDFYASLVAGGTILVTGGRPSVSLSTDNGDTWETHTLDTAALMSDLAFNGTTFIVVGERGNIFASPDGRTWTKRDTPPAFAGSSSGAAYGAGVFVAAGSTGQVLASPDGAAWVVHPLPTTEPLSDVAYGPSQ